MGKTKKHLYTPSKGPEDWQALLAEPVKQWKDGYSAKALACCWEEAVGFPESVKSVFAAAPYPPFQSLVPLIAIPEYQVPLPGGSRSSQNDLFVLARSVEGLMTMAVEGKVQEPFGPTVSEWMHKPSPGKKIRLDSIRERLELRDQVLDHVRYQLLHRTASALILAEQFHAHSAMMIVHSFSREHACFKDYNSFLDLFDKIGKPGSVTYAGRRNGRDLFFAWVTGEERYLGFEKGYCRLS